LNRSERFLVKQEGDELPTGKDKIMAGSDLSKGNNNMGKGQKCIGILGMIKLQVTKTARSQKLLADLLQLISIIP